jgi:peptidoglycan hydrolase CwlO-like protein
MIVQADYDLFVQQKEVKGEYDVKQKSLANKLAKLNGMKTEYDGMHAQILEQKKHYEDMKLQFQKQDQDMTNGYWKTTFNGRDIRL